MIEGFILGGIEDVLYMIFWNDWYD